MYYNTKNDFKLNNFNYRMINNIFPVQFSFKRSKNEKDKHWPLINFEKVKPVSDADLSYDIEVGNLLVSFNVHIFKKKRVNITEWSKRPVYIHCNQR